MAIEWSVRLVQPIRVGDVVDGTARLLDELLGEVGSVLVSADVGRLPGVTPEAAPRMRSSPSEYLTPSLGMRLRLAGTDCCVDVWCSYQDDPDGHEGGTRCDVISSALRTPLNTVFGIATTVAIATATEGDIFDEWGYLGHDRIVKASEVLRRLKDARIEGALGARVDALLSVMQMRFSS